MEEVRLSLKGMFDRIVVFTGLIGGVMKMKFSCLLGTLLLLAGCVTYTIDSNPQGLRVTINEIERGVTPCEFTVPSSNYRSLEISVAPPTTQQINVYKFKTGEEVKSWCKTAQKKRIDVGDGGGTVFFQFISEDDTNNEIDDSVYIIDSVPQGLRVVVNDFERGVTPCILDPKKYLGNTYLSVEVTAPTKQQLKQYEEKHQKVVSTWWTQDKRKLIDCHNPGGRILFNFIASEYDIPKTEADWEWLKNAIKEDEEDVKREREMYLRLLGDQDKS